MNFASPARLLSAAVALPFIFACSSITDATRRPVNLSVKASTSTSTGASAGVATSAALQISSLRLAVTQASLGSGEQFGCVNCQGGAEENELGTVGAIVSVPLDGSAVNLATEQVSAGSYPQVEIELGSIAATGWSAGQTVEIQGTNNGTAFTIRVAVNGSFHETLTPPVVVTSASTSIPVVITLPVSSWFSAGATALDPAVPAQLAQIEANIRTAFSGPESGR